MRSRVVHRGDLVTTPRISHLVTPRSDEFQVLVEDLVASLDVGAICEVGGGATPMLSADFKRRHGFRYVVIDVSAQELARAPAHVETVHGDISDPRLVLPGSFDLVVTRWVLEHVMDPRPFHLGVGRLLHPGGRAVHHFPTLYALPFVANRVAPERLATMLLGLSGEDRRPTGKFPARYRWCRGPTRRQIRRLEGVGFAVERYVGYYGHVYFNRVPLGQRMEEGVATVLARRRVAHLTSYASVILAHLPSEVDPC